MRKVLSALLERAAYSVVCCSDGIEAQAHFAKEDIGVVITDQKMPRMDGLALLRYCLRAHPDIPVILITAHGTIETAVQAIKEGAFDYITKPFDETELLGVVQKAIQYSEQKKREPHDLSQGFCKSVLIGDSPAMEAIRQKIQKVADSPSTVLLMGETGTGKEILARTLHAQSRRRNEPFIAVNCGAIPGNLMESELFGYERGAFTGAVTNKPGRFELAHGGTLFLDEVGEINKEIQIKLLRVLQERTFERIGGVKTLQVDIRLIAATNRDLACDVREGLFRSDLYYRLHVVSIHVPPLRDRIQDIPDFISYFLGKLNRKLGKKVRSLSDEAMQVLLAYPFPGNIRELENILEAAILLSDGEVLSLSDLPETMNVSFPLPNASDFKTRSREITSQIEKDMILKALEETGGNITHAAQRLGLSRRGLQIKIKAYEL